MWVEAKWSEGGRERERERVRGAWGRGGGGERGRGGGREGKRERERVRGDWGRVGGGGRERGRERVIGENVVLCTFYLCVCSVKKEKFWFQIMSILGV